jgi:adenylate cyclase class 2
MLEIEVKHPCGNLEAIRSILTNWGAHFVEKRADADHYYNAPDRDFAKTDEAFRIRRIGSKNLLTYKGPKIDAQTKTRLEIEVPAAEGDEIANDLQRLVTSLGYRPVAVVRKRREVHELRRERFNLHFCLDEVEGVGTFVEIEIVAEEKDLDAARSILLKTAEDMGLGPNERRSYLQMLLQSQSEPRPSGSGNARIPAP